MQFPRAGTRTSTQIRHRGEAAHRLSNSWLRGAAYRARSRCGGNLDVRVADKDGNPVSGGNVVVMPKDPYSEPDLAAKRIVGETDQNGTYSTRALAPSVYHVLATTTSVAEPTPESIAKLWRARSKAKEVEVGPNATVQVTLEAVTLDTRND